MVSPSLARRPGTLFAPFLLRGQRLAEAYIARNTQSPDLVASAVEEIIHRGKRVAPHRCVIGASPEMRFVVRYLPQWVLDAATRAQENMAKEVEMKDVMQLLKSKAQQRLKGSQQLLL